ncbi:CRISPR-associated protein [Halothiobacillus diazotrophicus]|uniref:CRISPR-associated protein n=1 Tax=Halothiobacillus diazotrophicus TaxID=1860122 RepID=A0A191ZFK3_9GAMM|nr:TIGR02221 family CRISPR-associated protein [Halothiobacillus diazotrophicus]ANJ66648.1 CRISPR-associated protein [Halothiobacillus diazotrophicus]
MPTTLLTLLGKGRDNPQTGYRDATYDFPDGQARKTPYFGLALADYLGPEHVVILGTAGSMWGALLEHHTAQDADEHLRLELMEAEAEGRVTQTLLDQVAPLFRAALGHQINPRLVPAGSSPEEQIEILSTIAEQLGKQQHSIHFDLTHGFRHLGMIGFLSAFMIERLRQQIQVEGLWYGALDMTRNGITPVLRLDGLNAVQQWVSALDKFDVSGDYGVFTPLLQADGLPEGAAQCLIKAAHFERISNISNAASQLRTVIQALKEPLGGASSLFQETLHKRLSWASKDNLAEQQRLLAQRALDRGDALRAAILGLEALITHLCLEQNYDPLNYQDRENIGAEFQGQIRAGEHPQWLKKAYWTLNDLRNSMAHGTRPKHPDNQKLMQNPERLISGLQSILSTLTNHMR